MIEGHNRRERADYRQLATLAFWLGGYWSKRPAKPDKLLGEKTETATDAADFIAKMNAKKKREDKDETIDLDEVVTLDMLGEAPLDDWYWTNDSKVEVEE